MTCGGMSQEEAAYRPVAGLPVFQEDFGAAAAAACGDEAMRAATLAAAMKKYEGRIEALKELPDAEGLRELAARIKAHTVEHLDYYLAQFAEKVRAAGGTVHFATSAAEANERIVAIARDNNCRGIVKAKSMATEETQLNAALAAAGMAAVETDLGEFIVQVTGDRPSHLIMPVMHMNRRQIGRVFAEYFHVPFTDDPPALAEMARVHLRTKFHQADMGISGVNFGIAETGSIVVCTNEGNGRMCTTRPRIHVALMGMEKLLPRLADLGVFLKLLARSGTGQSLTQYTNIITGPRRGDEHDGPEQLHVVILDNGRRRILDSEYRDVLRCIRCGACLNACPVYRTIGGHAYGVTIPGPIGSLLAPLLNGMGRHPELPHASSLCGACVEACPVKIPIPDLLIRARRDMAVGGAEPAPARPAVSWGERLLFRAWTLALGGPWRYRAAQWMQRFLLRSMAAKGGGWIARLPGPARGWTQMRDFPPPAAKTFRQMWKERGR
jgi:L-lactate dehydrogenase complex protein LldF